MKSNSGVSIITVIITIIVIIILASISISQIGSQEKASYAKFAQEMQEVQKGVETKRLSNYKYGKEYANDGFYKVIVTGSVPSDFEVITENGQDIGYLVDLEYLGYDNLVTGQAYTNFVADGENVKTVTFGQDDVYVYDADGTVYYARGFLSEGVMYYK